MSSIIRSIGYIGLGYFAGSVLPRLFPAIESYSSGVLVGLALGFLIHVSSEVNIVIDAQRSKKGARAGEK